MRNNQNLSLGLILKLISLHNLSYLAFQPSDSFPKLSIALSFAFLK